LTATPETMTAIEIVSPGAPEQLRPARRPVPQPAQGEVLIRVRAAGVNRPDVLQRKGLYAPPPGTSDIPGLEVAGEIAALGSGVRQFRLGEAVTALVAGGGYAQWCVAPAPQCLPVPGGLTLIEAAAIPETYFTVWTNVFDRGNLRAGESVLIHGGASGIGTTAIQLAKAFDARVFATAAGPERCAACVGLGAERAFDRNAQDFVAEIKAVTQGKGVELILDMVGGDYVARNFEALAPEGRLVQIAFLRSPKVELDLGLLMRKRLWFTGSTLRPRSVAEKGEIAAALREKVWPLLAAGRAKPRIHATFPLADAAGAHRLMESNAHIGKIVLLTEG
jgi:NADPH:quinone reductase